MQRRLFLIVSIFGMIAAGCGGGGGGGGNPPTAPPPPGGGGTLHEVEVLDFSFNPRSLVVQPGDTVRWVMRGTEPGHTVTERNGEFDSGFVFVNDGDIYERTFTAAENGQTFEYRCSTHQGCCQMQGSVRVGNTAPPPSPGY